ncbi:hypothetical protein ACO2I3_15650 [Leptospira interrogans]
MLLDNYAYNCGVFFAAAVQSNRTIIFTDPLGQYPIFYWQNGDRYLVSPDLYAIARALPNATLNDDCIYDYVTYFHPLRQETLLSGVKRLLPYETIVLTAAGLKINRIAPDQPTLSYPEILDISCERLKARATTLLAHHSPICHLSGGLDTRLSLAALLSAGFRGPVFSYGDGLSQDRLISRELTERLGLSEGRLRFYHSPPKTVPDLQQALRPFNGMKLTDPVNFGTGSDFSHSEVTGYFSEGLLKGFGSLFDRNRFTMFDWGRRTSSLPPEVFNLPTDRAEEEARALLELTDNPLVANCLFYLRNRSPGHFGAHSTVANREFVSIDLLYDPFLLNLIRMAPYSATEIKAGAIIVDLIKHTYAEDLAVYPYDERIVPRYAPWTHTVTAPSCFESYHAQSKELPRLPVHVQSPPLGLPGCPIANVMEHFSSVLRRFPLLKATRNGNRGIEAKAVTSLLCLIDDLETAMLSNTKVPAVYAASSQSA